MKKIIQLVSFLGLVFILCGVTANAQAVTNVDAKIPFDFVVGDKTLPAGSYLLRITNTPSSAQLLEIRDADQETHFKGLMFTNGDRNKERAELTFDRTSGNAILTKIIIGEAGYSLPRSESANLVANDRQNKGKTVRN